MGAGAVAPPTIRLALTAGSALLIFGFFMPWVDGAAEFAARDFSGFDLARLVRNFEIASSSDGSEQLRVTAAALYLAPAFAVNAGVAAWLPVSARFASIAAGVAGAYSLVLLIALAVLAAVSWTDLGRVLSGPLSGFYLSGLGAALLAAGSALLLLRSRAQNLP